jgi:YVTN family beta-propeller protein
LLRRALSLWRGPPLADLGFEPAVQVDVRRLEQARLTALERSIDAELAVGRDGDLVPELESLVATHPLEERLHRQLMVALDRAGRPVDALAVYQALRQRLATEVGLEPSRELSELQLKILRRETEPARDTVVDGGAMTQRVRKPGAAGRPLLFGGVVLLAISGVLATLLKERGRAAATVAPNSVAVIDSDSNRVLYDISTGDAPVGPATDGRSVWIASGDSRTISRLPQRRGGIPFTVGTGTTPSGLAVAAGSTWVSNLYPSDVVRVDGRYGTVEHDVQFEGVATRRVPSVLASGEGAVWLARRFERLRKIDPRTNAVVRIYSVVTRGEALAVGFGGAWVGAANPNRLVHVDLRSGRASTVPLVHAPRGISVGAGSVWVIVAGDAKVWRIDPRTNAVTDTIRLGEEPSGIAFGAGAVWVSNPSSGTVSKIDPTLDRVVATVRIGHVPAGIAVAHGRVWGRCPRIALRRTAEDPPGAARRDRGDRTGRGHRRGRRSGVGRRAPGRDAGADQPADE